MPTFVAGVLYGLLSFAAGFVFGALRELVLIRAFGAAAGHLIEFPLMLVAVAALAAVLFRTQRVGAAAWTRLVAGGIGVIVLVAIESTFALGVLRRPVAEYLASYDVTAGALFPWGLLWMAVAPLVVGRRS